MTQMGQYLQVAIGSVLLVAALTKLHRPAPAARFAARAGMPDRLARASVIGLGAVELGLGASAVTLASPLAVGLACLALCALFAAAILIPGRGAPTPCGCFGALDTAESVGLQELRTVALLAIAIVSAALIGGGQASTAGADGTPALTAEGIATGLAFVVAFATAQRAASRLSRLRSREAGA